MKLRKDPVEESPSAGIENGEVKMLTLEDLTPGTLSMNVVRASDPFATYPLKTIKTGKMIPVLDDRDRPIRGKEREETICLTHVLLYNHVAKPLKNSPNNRGAVKTSHNRSIQDPATEENHDLVFDRIMKTKKGEFQYCVIPNHALRAQCYFKYNEKTKRIEQDARYLLLDDEQGKPLLRLFQMIINPKIKLEKQADYIMGQSDVDPGEPVEE